MKKTNFLALLAMITLLIPLATAQVGIISTVAGMGEEGFAGDDDDATAAQLNRPMSVVVDNMGNLFIADRVNHRIRKVDTTGNISTVAGSGTPGFSGDGGPATAAQLSLPAAVAVDNAGNLFIADQFNDRIRKVDVTGNISTVAGTTQGFSGDGAAATAAQLNRPADIAVDNAGNLFIADRINNRIRKVDTAGNISTIAGDGTLGFGGDGGPATAAQLGFPDDIAIDNAGNLFIADNSNSRIRKVDTAGNISTVAGDGIFEFSGDGGPAIAAQLNFPFGIAVDNASNLLIADTYNHRIRKVDTAGNISTIAGDGTLGFGGDGGPATAAQLNAPTGVAIDSAGNLFLADFLNHRIRKVVFPSD